jgi:O-antigen ligase
VLSVMSSLRDRALPLRLPLYSLPALAFALAALCWGQWGSGLVPYLSDAMLAALYLSAFGLCAVVAGSMPAAERDTLADRLSMALAAAALVSVALAVVQWLGILRLDMNLPVPGGRPVAHMEQANMLCSLLIQGAFGIWRLAERRRLGAWTAMLLGAPVLLGIVLTQSRVAWLVVAVVVGAAVWRRGLFAWNRGRAAMVTVVLVIAIGTLILPWLDGQLGLAGATLAERVSEGRRPVAWALFVDAAATRPWAGWGVLQNGAAQFALADRHPSLGYSFSSAHNLVIDLMIWFGVPVGLLAGAAVLWALLRRLDGARNAPALVTALAAAALVLHGMVEFPLHYAHFLLPLALFVGISAPERVVKDRIVLSLPSGARLLLPILSLASAMMLALLGQEYIATTNVRPVLAYDKPTRHLVLIAESAPPELALLDQLRAYHVFAALEVAPGMSPADLEGARVAMQRTPFPTSIERYALLAGMNGRDAEARDAMRRVCKFETPRQCERSQFAWAIWREKWPQLPDVFDALSND